MRSNLNFLSQARLEIVIILSALSYDMYNAPSTKKKKNYVSGYVGHDTHVHLC